MAAFDIRQLPPISPFINNAFILARAKYSQLHGDWTNTSAILSGRFSLPVAMMNLQRLGDLDLVLRAMEDEFETNKAASETDTTGLDLTFHYQITLSEIWIVSCYEILRTFRQRDNDAQRLDSEHVALSGSEIFKAILLDLELLRMPMVKFEIAKDKHMKEPLVMEPHQTPDGVTLNPQYNKDNPSRYHIMPSGISERGSMLWAAVDHFVPSQRWIERRDLSDRILAFAKSTVPAGILEAQRIARSSKAE